MVKPARIRAYGQNIPLVDVFPFPVFKTSAPSTTDKEFEVGQVWIYNSSPTTRQAYMFGGLDSSGDAIWVITGPGSSDLDQLGCDAGDDPVSPQAGKIDLLGTASQIVTTGDDGAASITWSLADATSIVTSLTVPLIIGDDSGSLNIKLGDAGGTDDLNILDSADAVVANIDSNGGANFVNLVTSGTTQTIGNSSSATTVAIGGGVGGNSISIGNGANTGAQTINLANGASAANSTINILSGNGSAGTQTLNVLAGNRAGALNLATGAAAHVITVGSASAGAIAVDTAAGISLDGATASNFTVTGASEDLTLSSSGGSVNVTASEAAADAIVINASDAAGGVQIQAGSNGILIGNQADCAVLDLGNIAPTASRTITVGGGQVATAGVADTIDIGVDAVTTEATASKVINIGTGTNDTGSLTLNMVSGTITSGTVAVNLLTGTGTKTLNIGNSTGTTTNIDGPLLVNDSVNSNTSINTGTSNGTVSIGNSAAGAIAVDTAAGVSIDGATASNFTVTGASENLTLASVGGSVVISATEDAPNAISLTSNGGATETIVVTNTQGTDVASIQLTSTVGGVTLDSGLASADAINLSASAGGVDIDGALQVNIASSQNAADAIRIIASAGGIDIDAVGSAGEDIVITNTGGSISMESTEAQGDAITITASDASGGVIISAGTGNVNVSGNLVLSDVATQLQMNGGAVTDFIGTATLNNGTVTVANTNIASTDRIFFQRQDINGSSALGDLTYAISAATSFTITSRNRTTPANTETNDDSILMYWIVRQN